MTGAVAALYRHPIKGYTPETVQRARLMPGAPFPGDRLFAVEDGPCGFDPAAPRWIAKQNFTVLANIAAVAGIRTHFDDASGLLHAQAAGATDIAAAIHTETGRAAFAAWLTEILGDEARGPLRLVDGGGHRFLDHPRGHVSIINLASIRDLAARLGAPVDPLRFRANLYVEGWAAWVENDWTGRGVRLGAAAATVFQPITRCAATMVDPVTAIRDLDIPGALHRFYGHVLCGIYVHIETAGEIAVGAYAGPTGL